jgi:hypothetical protein
MEEAMATEIERFAEDLERNDLLCQELADFAGTFEELAGWLGDKGYRIGARQLEEIMSAAVDGLSDDQLDEVSGGSGMSEEMSLRLQMATDRRSKFLQTLSNIMKNTSDTRDAIINNIK